MENDETNTTAVQPPSIGIQLTKMVLGTVAGFLAGKLVEKGVDSLVAARRNSTEDTPA